eukprot:6257473-Pyramimonas_sp.AAC.1
MFARRPSQDGKDEPAAKRRKQPKVLQATATGLKHIAEEDGWRLGYEKELKATGHKFLAVPTLPLSPRALGSTAPSAAEHVVGSLGARGGGKGWHRQKRVRLSSRRGASRMASVSPSTAP